MLFDMLTKDEKKLLEAIPNLILEAQSMLRLLTFLLQSGKEVPETEINKWLDRISYLQKLEEELKKKE
jgi:hypothetical protein